MNDLDRELADLTAAATRYAVAPPAAAIRHRAAVRRRARAATAAGSALAIAGAITAVFVLGPQDKAADLPPTAPTTTAPTTTAPTAAIAVPTPAVSPPADPAPTAVPTEAVASESGPAPATSIPASSAPAAIFPPFAKDLTHGGKTWAVFLVVSKDGNDPRYATARDQLTAAGYPGFDGEARERAAGDLGCDSGAQDGLAAAGIAFEPGVYYTGMAVYFDTKAQADAFVAAYQPGVVGTVEVTYMCAD